MTGALTLVLPMLLAAGAADAGALRRAGDVDADGVPDLLWAQPSKGIVWVLSGRDGALRLSAGDAPGFGAAVAAVAAVGDVDGDGHDDVLVGACGRALLHSGDGGRLLREHASPRDDRTFGRAVGGGGDVDADGVPDYVVGEPLHSGPRSGRAYVHSGRTGVLLRTFEGTSVASLSWTPDEEPPDERTPGAEPERHVQLGRSVCIVPDLDGDGRDEVALGAPVEWANPVSVESGWSTWTGYVELASVATGRALLGFAAADAYGPLGSTVAPAGDVDGDDVPDLLVAAEGSKAWVLSGASGEPLHVHSPRRPGSFRTVDSLGDVDGDGRADRIVGGRDDFLGTAGFAEVHSSLGVRLWWWDEESRDPPRGGVDVCGLGDVDGDGIPDLAVLDDLRSRVTVLSGRELRVLRRVDSSDLEKAWSRRSSGAGAPGK